MEHDVLGDEQLSPRMGDLNQPNGMVDSPESPVTDPAQDQVKQVPISRNAGSGYDRPERARTSHACEPCRERKTKCDGERPSCRRCLFTNATCHYGYGKGWKKRKYVLHLFCHEVLKAPTRFRIVEDLTVTSRKLARYEELLNDIFPLVTDNVRGMIEDAREQVVGMQSTQ